MAERERDLERLLTFVDAIVAIAITLLVLPLADAAAEVGDRTVAQLLRDQSDHLFGFALSFTVIARLWVAQHRIVRPLARQSSAVLSLMLLWAFTIAFLPFPTGLVAGSAGSDQLTKILYLGTMAASSAVLAGVAWVVGRDPELRDGPEVPAVWPTAAIATVFLLALAVSLALPATSYWPLLLLLLVDPIGQLVRSRRPSAG